jgi:hypothetical protein
MERIKLNKLRNWYVKNDILFIIERKRSKITLLSWLIASFRNCMIDSTFEISVLEAVIKQLKIDIKKLYGLLHV